MNTLISQVEDYVANNIAYFHSSRIDKLKSLQLNRLIKSKNPYLYKAKNLNTPQEIVESIASAFLSSAEESMFGDWLEGLAIFIANIVYNGYKSSAEGIDLEMDKDGTHYFISIKSGPKWSNSSSLKKLKENFLKAKRIYHTSGNRNLCEAIEGCCYGKENNIIEPLGIDAAEKNQQYKQEYDKMITRFTRDFISLYCDSDGNILWNKIVYINSGK